MPSEKSVTFLHACWGASRVHCFPAMTIDNCTRPIWSHIAQLYILTVNSLKGRTWKSEALALAQACMPSNKNTIGNQFNCFIYLTFSVCFEHAALIMPSAFQWTVWNENHKLISLHTVKRAYMCPPSAPASKATLVAELAVILAASRAESQTSFTFILPSMQTK